MPRTVRPLAERFWEKVQKGEGCWTWTASRFRGGYGYFLIEKGRSTSAHRMAYEIAKGAIPDGMVVCHSCDNKSCVRPDHLFVGTQKDNIRDAITKGLFAPVRAALALCRANDRAKTHCRHGHAFTPENTYHDPQRPERRACKTCRMARDRARWAA